MTVCLHRELRELLEFGECSINMVDADGNSVRSYGIAADGTEEVLRGPIHPSIEQVMQSGTPLYRRNRAEVDEHRDGGHAHTRSIVDVPISGGTLAINSTEEDAFSESSGKDYVGKKSTHRCLFLPVSHRIRLFTKWPLKD